MLEPQNNGFIIDAVEYKNLFQAGSDSEFNAQEPKSDVG